MFRHATSRKAKGPFAVLKLLDQRDFPRLGVTIPKRLIPRAVDRNRVKRYIREWFRLNQAIIEPVDIVLLLRRPIQQDAVSAALDSLLPTLTSSD